MLPAPGVASGGIRGILDPVGMLPVGAKLEGPAMDGRVDMDAGVELVPAKLVPAPKPGAVAGSTMSIVCRSPSVSREDRFSTATRFAGGGSAGILRSYLSSKIYESRVPVCLLAKPSARQIRREQSEHAARTKPSRARTTINDVFPTVRRLI